MIITVRTTTGRENASLTAISTRIQARKIPIKSLFFTDDLRGYIFIEGETEDIEKAVKNIPHVRGLINKEVNISELEKFLIAEKSEIKYDIGDIIEVVGGPFKGEKAKITRMDEAKSEITIELLEAVIPIPVTISISIIRLYEKKK
ncbi:MAG: transcription elongation factor Spt5 [Candidatus Aenigmarchaeota archaeon]|nr:transcription elongation factor Spt5 [Candidatus Aenigmarchaeota archaeon]